MTPRASTAQIVRTALPMPSLPGVLANLPGIPGLRTRSSRAHFYQAQLDTYGDEQ